MWIVWVMRYRSQQEKRWQALSGIEGGGCFLSVAVGRVAEGGDEDEVVGGLGCH